MAQLTTDGLLDLRNYVEANWTHIEIRNASGAGTTGTAIVRLPLSDARVDWVHTASTNPLKLRVTLTGSDADVPVPVTARSGALYKVASGGVAMGADTFVEGDATINADADSIQVTLDVEIPEIP